MGHTHHPQPDPRLQVWFDETQKQNEEHAARVREWADLMPTDDEERSLAKQYESALQRMRAARRVEGDRDFLVATLVVNFGPKGRVLPDVITGDMKSIDMLLTVLTELSTRCGLHPKPTETEK